MNQLNNQNKQDLLTEIKFQESEQSLKHSLHKILKESTTNQKDKVTSIQTILSISNGMVGSAAIVLPVLFQNYGVVNSLVISFVICLISCKSTLLLVEHNLQNEMDIPDTIERILGRKWKILFNVVSIIFLFSCGLIIIILICSLIYPIIQLIAQQLDSQIPPQTSFTLTQFSYQWVGIIYMICIFPILLLKRIGPLLRLLSYGAISICISILFIMIKGISNIVEHKEQLQREFPTTSNYFATLSGVFSLAYLAQSLIIPIRQQQKRYQDRQSISVLLFQKAFVWTWIVYALIGIFGTIALTTQSIRDGTNGATLLEYYPANDFMATVLQTLMFLQLSTAFPVIQWITRSRFFGLIYGTKQPSRAQYLLFTVVFSILCLVVQMINANLAMIISYAGAFVGIFMEILIPVALHLQCVHHVFTREQIEDYTVIKNDSCNDHTHILKRASKHTRMIFYGLLLLIGLVIAILQILNIFIVV